MKKFLICIFTFISFYVMAQTNPMVVTDEKSNSLILLGSCNRADFKKVPFLQDYESEYRNYVINDTLLNKIRNINKKYTIKIIMACWCEDSKIQVPRFYKLIDHLQISDSQIELICVDRDKKAPLNNYEALNIEWVPTFIIYSEGIELGRIIENPKVSLEFDVLQILEK